MIYLDHQASTPVHPAALAAMQPYFTHLYANPHAIDHAAGWEAGDAVENSRATIARRIGADSDEIVFTSGATEANNLALLGLAEQAGERQRVVVSAIEHKCVLAPARELERRGFELVVAPVGAEGRVDPDQLARLIDERTLLVSVMLVNNEIGTVQPISRIAEACAGAGAMLHTDAAQALAWMPMSVDDLGVDMLSLSAHKAGGPKGVGALYIRRDKRHRFRPLIQGGEQEGGLRAGTTPTPLCVGMAEACRAAPSDEQIRGWRASTARLWQGLQDSATKPELIGGEKARHPGNLCIRFPGIDAERLVAVLQPDVAVARGSACTSGIPEPSHVLRAIGLSMQQCAEALRLSTAVTTTEDEIDIAVAHFRSALACLNRPS